MRTLDEEADNDDDDIMLDPVHVTSAPALPQRFLKWLKGGSSSAKSDNPLMNAPSIIEVHTGKKKKDECCQCSSKLYFCSFLVLMIVVLIAVAIVVSLGNYWADLRDSGESITSLYVRWSNSQYHHTIDYFTDQYGDRMSLEEVSTEDIKPVARLYGSVDLHEKRVDWEFTLNNAGLWIGEAPALSLWMMQFNTTTNFLSHVNGSPLILSPIFSGTIDKINIPALSNKTTVFTLAVNGQMSHQWVIPVR